MEHTTQQLKNTHASPCVHGTVIKTDHRVDHKTSLKKVQRVVIRTAVPDHNAITLEINNSLQLKIVP